MCGITGFVSPSLNKDHLVNMTNSLAHRGPDADGFYHNESTHVGLGHRRLSILDLSSAANQPMTSHCKRYVMVYNGEVYNYKNLSKEIGITFHTNSDSEIILEAFVKWGPEFVNKLNGMFSIAIYDLEKNKLFLFRDRIGIKPLYYYLNNDELVFASELKAITGIKKELTINFQAVSNYFHYGYIPKKDTIYNDVYKLSSGYYGEYFNGNFEIKKYWEIDSLISSQTNNDFETAKKTLDQLLTDSIDKRLVSDVPIGTFLSGGTDSSAVTSIAAKISETQINTFSIGFKEAKYNESEKAKEIAKHLKTNHHEFIVAEQDIFSELDHILDNFDEPFADSSCFPTYLVSKLARKHVTVCLSGDGGDELFMGYGSYNWAKRMSNPILWNLRKPISKILKSTNDNRKKRAADVFNSPLRGKMEHLFSQEQYLFSAQEINELLLNCPTVNYDDPIKSNRVLSPEEKQSFFDIKNYLKDDLLVKVDRMSMLSSLEVRVPILDHRIVEFALNLDQSLKMSKTGVQKHLLKEVLYDNVSKELLNHPKWGFSIPLVKWLKNDLSFLIDKYLDDEIIRELKIFNPEYIKQLKYRFLNGDDYLYNRIWQLIVFNRFMIKNIERFKK